MKSQVVSFCFALSAALAAGQNLVPNGSFEEHNGCPKTFGQFSFCDTWLEFRNTPDYFHECSEYFAGVPDNAVAFQYAKDGVAYAGLTGFWTANANFREHIGVELLVALNPGTKYYASFWISKSEKMATTIIHNMHGIRFSTYANTNGDGTPLQNWAHIYSEEMISDTVNWTQIKGSFVADSAYTYMAIGNFFDDDHTTILIPSSVASGDAYYLIDDVRLSTDSLFEYHLSIPNGRETGLIKTYPNPSTDFVHIEANKEISEWKVLAASGGTLVAEGRCYSKRLKVPVESFSPGLYILEVTFSDQTKNSSKLIKIHTR
jgi:hypothetical protein